MQFSLHKARLAGGPVIEKWELFERHALLLLMLSVTGCGALLATGYLYGSLVILGACSGFLVVGAYVALFAARPGLAGVLATLAALLGAAIAAGYVSQPLWVILANGLSGLFSVVSIAAAWTRNT